MIECNSHLHRDLVRQVQEQSYCHDERWREYVHGPRPCVPLGPPDRPIWLMHRLDEQLAGCGAAEGSGWPSGGRVAA